MKRPVFINLAVDRSNVGCAYAQTDLGVVRPTLSYAGAIQDRACFMTIARCSYCKRFVR